MTSPRDALAVVALAAIGMAGLTTVAAYVTAELVVRQVRRRGRVVVAVLERERGAW